MAIWFLGGALLVNADRFFEPVISYYRQFRAEPAHAANTFIEVGLDNRDAKFGAGLVRFNNFLELIQGLTSVSARGYAVVVNHGASDANDHPLGLLLDFAATQSPWRVDEYTLGLLADMIGKQPTDAALNQLEKTSTIGPAKTPLPPGTLRTLDNALKQLRNKPLERVEIRACNLGGNLKVMQLLKKVLGVTGTLSAPDVHMFYGPGASPNTSASSDTGFKQWQTSHRRARIFTDATKRKPGSYGLQVSGKHSQRGFEFNATTSDVSWFVEQNIMPGRYTAPPPGGRLIPPFMIAGMDDAASFLLPQEPAYRGHIVEV